METNLARLADTALDRLGDHPSLYFEGVWHSSATLHERSMRVASGLRDVGVAHGRRVKAALRARARHHPGPVLRVGLDGFTGHGTSVAATSRIRSPAPDAIGPPWPKHAVSTSRAANR